MKKLVLVILVFCFASGFALFAEEKADELKFSYNGEAYFYGRYGKQNNMEDESYAYGRARQYFTAAKGDFKSVVKLEIDPIIGKGATTDYFDVGSDQKGVIEVKNVYLEFLAFDIITFTGGVFGYKSPGKFLFNTDVPGASMAAKFGDITADFTWIKHTEGNTVGNGDDISYTTATVKFPVSMVDIHAGVTLGTASHWENMAIIPQVAASAEIGAVSGTAVVAMAFGDNKPAGTKYGAFAAKLDADVDLEPVDVKVFGLFLSGDDTADSTQSNWGSFLLVRTEGLDQTGYFYYGGLMLRDYGKNAYTTGGAISFGAAAGTSLGGFDLELLGAYHLAAATTNANKDYGLEGDLRASYGIAKDVKLEAELDVFLPGTYYGSGLNPEFQFVIGPKVKW
jgi:hypothetical protein